MKKTDYIYILSGIITIIGTICHIFELPYSYIIFGLGSIGITICRISSLKHFDDVRLRRLQNIQAISTVLLLGTTYLIYAEKTIWIITLLLAACFDLLISIRMPKSNSNQSNQ